VTTHFVAVNAKGFATSYFLLPKDDWHSEDKVWFLCRFLRCACNT
jgi:hypothetical protein